MQQTYDWTNDPRTIALLKEQERPRTKKELYDEHWSEFTADFDEREFLDLLWFCGRLCEYLYSNPVKALQYSKPALFASWLMSVSESLFLGDLSTIDSRLNALEGAPFNFDRHELFELWCIDQGYMEV